MDLLIALLLGAMSGVIGFLPVSSSGHMVILEKLTGVTYPRFLFHSSVHGGLIIAVLVTMRRDVTRLIGEILLMLRGLTGRAARLVPSRRKKKSPDSKRPQKTNYRRLLLLLAVSCVPTAVLGLLLQKAAESMSGSVLYTGIGLMLTGIVLFVTDMVPEGNCPLKDLPLWKMVCAGAAQGVAVLPGLSRSALTITAGIFAGLSKKTAVRISYLMFILPGAIAFFYEIKRGISEGAFAGNVPYICAAGFLGAAISGGFMMKRMVRLVIARPFRTFAVYCIAAGVAALIISFI